MAGCENKITLGQMRQHPAAVCVKGHVVSKRGNDANNVFRSSDRPLTEHEKDQSAQRKNLERLRADRLAREAAGTPIEAKKAKSKKKGK